MNQYDIAAHAVDLIECRRDLWVRAESSEHAFALWLSAYFQDEISVGEDDCISNLDEAEDLCGYDCHHAKTYPADLTVVAGCIAYTEIVGAL
jgi:hypothetical protein